MGLLDSLAQGLRGAGAIMDEGVYKGQRQEETIQMQLQERRKDLMAQQVIKAAESGAMPPEAAQQALAQLGHKGFPVGPDAATQQRQEEIKRRDAISRSFGQLTPEDRSNPLRVGELFLTHGDHATGARYIDMATQRAAAKEKTIAEMTQRAYEFQARSEDKTLDRESRDRNAANALRLQEQVAAATDAFRRESLEIRRVMGSQGAAPTVTEIADPNDPTKAIKIDARTGRVIGAAPPKVAGEKSLPKGAIDSLTEAGGLASDFSRLTTNFQDSYGGKTIGTVGDAQNAVGRNIQGSNYANQAQWWQDYQDRKNVIRNKLFGSALTATEKGEFDKAQINPGMTPEQIKTNLGRQKTAADAAARKVANAYARGGYSKEQVEAALGIPLEALGAPAPATGGWSIKEK